MKCKVISCGRSELEEKLNEWLENNKIEISSVTQSQNNNYVTITILYYTEKENRKLKLDKLNNYERDD